MIKHIVLWRLKERAHGRTKFENAQEIKRKLEALNGRIEGLLKLEVGVDFSNTENSADLVLYSEFLTRKHLDAYQDHPEHQALMPYVLEARAERRVADYEV